MGPSGEQRPEPPIVGESVRLEARASGEARINQAARDLHLHFQDSVRGARRVEPATNAAQCPYPGLASFGHGQARWFFGRDHLTAELIERLDGRLRAGGIQMVVAPSGAGKSSLLRAGLLPKLGDGALPGSGRWPTVVFTPTAQPLQALATQIAALTGADPVFVAKQLAADSQRAGSVPRGRIRGVDPGARLVMVVDQFEELFTLCTDDRQRRTFVELLGQIADPRSAVGPDPHPVGLVVVGVRADFYAACANYPHLRTALQDSPLVVGPMSDAELRAAIRYPAQDVGLDVEAGLIELLLRDLGDTETTAGERGMTGYEAGRLPLLAHALRATWQQRHGHTLTVDGYRTTGGIHRAVATTADRVFASLNPAGQDAARTMFLRLIKIGDGTENTRRRVARTDLLRGLDSRGVWTVVDAFTQGRLLTQEQDTVEITHEALVRAWPRLRQWIDADRAGNLLRQELEEAAAVWTRERHDTAGLYRGSRLDAARKWAISKSNEGDLSPTAYAFLAVSAGQERRTAKLRRTVIVVLSVLALVASGAAAFAFQRSIAAENARDKAIFNQIIAQADRLRSTDVSLAAQLDLTAYRMDSTQDLYTTLITAGNSPLSTPLTDHTDDVKAVAFSPDGHTLASASADRTVRLWDVTDPTRPVARGQSLTGHTDSVLAVAFSPDGRTLASGSADRTVRLWDVANPTRPVALEQSLIGHADFVLVVAFSPDGRTLASGSADRTVRLWNVANPARSAALGQPLTGHTNSVKAVAFSADEHILVSGSADRTVRLWNVADPARPTTLGQPLTSHGNSVNAVVFSPDGLTLATGSADQWVYLWDMTDPAQPETLGLPLIGHTNAVDTVVFSPDGRTLASGSADQTIRLWDVTDRVHPDSLGPPLVGHTNFVNAVMFSPDGRTLASGSADQTARLWNIPYVPITGRNTLEFVVSFLTADTQANAVADVVFSPDGRILASGSVDERIRLWNVTDPAHPTPLGLPLVGHTNSVFTVAFSPDGRTLASGSRDKTIRLWDVADPAYPIPLGLPLVDHTDSIFAVAFSPDGRILASSSADKTVRLWDVTDPAHPIPLGQPLVGHTDFVNFVAFSPDGRTLGSGSGDRTVRLWDVTDPAHPIPFGQPLTGHTGFVFSVAFSPDGRTLVSGSADQAVRLWDVTDPAHSTPLGRPLTGHTNSVRAVAFSPDGRTLVSGSNDHTVRLWDVTDPAHSTLLGRPLTGHTNAVGAVVFSPDGRTLVSGSGDGTVRLWGMNVDQAIQRICATTRNTLTPEKWELYVSQDLPYNPPCP